MIRLCRIQLELEGEARLGAVHEGQVHDLTATGWPRFASLAQLLSLPLVTSAELRSSVERMLASSPVVGDFMSLCHSPEGGTPYLLAPIDRQEVWAAGVTYLRSREARERESELADVYARVYDAARPEIFFKATPSRVSGPYGPVCVRSDSAWTVPEPELALVLNSSLEMVGYTIGNDMSARDIEGANPLYLPQAKTYAGCCSLGPTIVISSETPLIEIDCTISRAGEVVFAGRVSTDQLKRSRLELLQYLGRNNSFPEGVVLLTGTGIVPPDDLALQDGDVVSIDIQPAGTLVNPVRQL
jgi:2-dehydro-3-deoxy-D-arabinonate dehydratase